MKSRIAPALLAVAATGLTAAGQGQFMHMGAPNTWITDMSADGTIIVGTFSNYGPAWRWTAQTGIVNIGGDGFQAKISRDGKTIVSNAEDANGISSAAIWIQEKQWKTLGGVAGAQPIDGNLSTAYSVSGDGSIVVGLAWVEGAAAHAFRWDAKTGMVDLGSLQGRNSRANVISSDGNVILGWDDNLPALALSPYDVWRGVMWWQGTERLLHPYGWVGQVEATNFNGTVFVGECSPTAARHAYRMDVWGRIDDLGALPRGVLPDRQEQEDMSIAGAVSDDGFVIGGQSGYKPPTDAFLWTPVTGMVKLSEFALRLGITGLDGWTLIGVSYIAPDGKRVAGTGINPDGQMEGYVITLP
jgi:probable HAF family extracellular repeat protein